MRSVCVHGHFYQPSRVNPWTDLVEPQPSAAPFLDWNHRITLRYGKRSSGNKVILDIDENQRARH